MSSRSNFSSSQIPIEKILTSCVRFRTCRDFIGRKDRPRLPADSLPKGNPNSYYANPLDAPSGFLTNGTLPVSAEQGVHSLTDVPVYAWGPGMENFRGVYNSPDIAFKIALALNLGRLTNVTLTV